MDPTEKVSVSLRIVVSGFLIRVCLINGGCCAGIGG